MPTVAFQTTAGPLIFTITQKKMAAKTTDANLKKLSKKAAPEKETQRADLTKRKQQKRVARPRY